MEIREDYVREAYRLISTSVMKLEKSPIEIMVEEFNEMVIDNKAVEVMVTIYHNIESSCNEKGGDEEK